MLPSSNRFSVVRQHIPSTEDEVPARIVGGEKTNVIAPQPLKPEGGPAKHVLTRAFSFGHEGAPSDRVSLWTPSLSNNLRLWHQELGLDPSSTGLNRSVIEALTSRPVFHIVPFGCYPHFFRCLARTICMPNTHRTRIACIRRLHEKNHQVYIPRDGVWDYPRAVGTWLVKRLLSLCMICAISRRIECLS